MAIFLKVTAGILIASTLSLVLVRQDSAIALLLTICVCCMVLVAAGSYLRPIIEFIHRLVQIGNINSEWVQILLKVVGIGLISQIVTLICSDAGNQSLGKALQIVAAAVILCVCIPVMEQMLTVIETILGEV
jgi:stage III sporulation protein AD